VCSFGRVGSSSGISCPLIAHRDNAVDHSNIGFSLSVRPRYLLKCCLCAQDLDRKCTTNIAREVKIIKLLTRQFLTDKSVLGRTLYGRIGKSIAIGPVRVPRHSGKSVAAPWSLKTIRKQASSL
jgi:hypothetical protein